MADVTLGIRRFRPDAKLPTRGSSLAAGMDVYAWIMRETDSDLQRHALLAADGKAYSRALITLTQGNTVVVKTGLNVRIPRGYELQVRSRSGLAAKHSVLVLNSPGTIDADYDGDGEKFELCVILHKAVTNDDRDMPLNIYHGDRIAQIVLAPVLNWDVEEVEGDNLNRHESTRAGGLGSTGVKG